MGSTSGDIYGGAIDAGPVMGERLGAPACTEGHATRGRLLLAPRAGAVAFLTDPRQPGWIPSYLQVPAPHLHLSGGTSPTGDDGPHVYRLPAGTDLEAVERQLLDAMRDGGRVAVAVSDAPVSGTLVLDGTGLRAVVVCPTA